MALNPPLDTQKLERTRFQLSTDMHECYRSVMTAETPLDDNRKLAKCWDSRRELWRQLITADHTLADLQLVLRFLQHQVRNSNWNVGVLGLRNICDVSNFREKLSLAGFWSQRILKEAQPREQALRELRRADEPKSMPEPKTPRQLMPALAKSWSAQAHAEIERPRE